MQVSEMSRDQCLTICIVIVSFSYWLSLGFKARFLPISLLYVLFKIQSPCLQSVSSGLFIMCYQSCVEQKNLTSPFYI